MTSALLSGMQSQQLHPTNFSLTTSAQTPANWRTRHTITAPLDLIAAAAIDDIGATAAPDVIQDPDTNRTGKTTVAA